MHSTPVKDNKICVISMGEKSVAAYIDFARYSIIWSINNVKLHLEIK